MDPRWTSIREPGSRAGLPALSGSHRVPCRRGLLASSVAHRHLCLRTPHLAPVRDREGARAVPGSSATGNPSSGRETSRCPSAGTLASRCSPRWRTGSRTSRASGVRHARARALQDGAARGDRESRGSRRRLRRDRARSPPDPPAPGPGGLAALPGAHGDFTAGTSQRLAPQISQLFASAYTNLLSAGSTTFSSARRRRRCAQYEPEETENEAPTRASERASP